MSCTGCEKHVERAHCHTFLNAHGARPERKNDFVFQVLHDAKAFDSITAASSSVADAKKMLLSRQARYSGLTDLLHFTEEPLDQVLNGADVWLTMNTDQAELRHQVEAAKVAGVKRIFVHVGADGPDAMLADAPALKSALDASGAEYTVMRARIMTGSGGSIGMILADIDETGVEEVPREDAFRFITEALTLSEANGRLFTLCPTEDDSQFREMRRAGCDRREEAKALLAGVISKGAKAAADAKAAEAEAAEAAKKPEVSPEEREAELKALLEKARLKGIETQERLKKENEEKARLRAERAEKMKGPARKEDEEEEKDASGKDMDGYDDSDDSSPPSPPSPPPFDPKGGGGGGEGGSGGDGGSGGKDKPDPPLALA